MGPVTRITGTIVRLLNFVVEESYYTMEVCLVLHWCFVKETAPKCGCLVDFFAISLPTMRACMHAHTCCLFKTGRKSTC